MSQYDYVVIGAGSAGAAICLAAALLLTPTLLTSLPLCYRFAVFMPEGLYAIATGEVLSPYILCLIRIFKVPPFFQVGC